MDKIRTDDMTKDEIVAKVSEVILTPERRAKGDVTVKASDRKGYDIRAKQSPMDYYYARRQLGDADEAYKRKVAAERLYRDWYTAGISQQLTIDFDKIRSADKRQFLPATERQREALDRFRSAISSVYGAEAKRMIISVCCEEEYLAHLKLSYYKNPRLAMPRLLEALDNLVDFYLGKS